MDLSSPTGGSPGHLGAKKPRLITVRKRDGGSFGFNLHGVKGKPGQVVKSVEAAGPALQVGLVPGDRVIEVNSICVVGETHSSVVGRIRDSGDVVKLLVVDEATFDLYSAKGLVFLEEDAIVLSSSSCPSEENRSSSSSAHSSSAESATVSPTQEAPPAHTFKKLKVKKRDVAKVAETDWAAKRKFFDDL